MIIVNRGKETTDVVIKGNFSDLMLESILAVKSIIAQIIDNAEHPTEIISDYLDALIKNAWGKE